MEGNAILQTTDTHNGNTVSSGFARSEEAVLKTLGITYLYPYQRLVISNVLDVLLDADEEAVSAQLAILPTGFGKSVCFQVPALMIKGVTIIVYPLKGLIADQYRRLSASATPVFCITGDTEPAIWEKVKQVMASTADCIILTNPESINSERFISIVGNKPINHLVIDEAHCVAEWGDTFRPSYLAVKDFIKSRNPRMISAFTATASPPVLQRLAYILFEHIPYKLVMATIDRPNIFYKKVWALDKNKTLKDLLAICEKPALVFTRSRTSAEILAQNIRIQFPNTQTYFYHAGLTCSEKKAVESWFYKSDSGILTATCAYGMGMDKKNIRTVIHYDMPHSIEAYIQEAGRAGRDGAPSDAVLIALWGNSIKTENTAMHAQGHDLETSPAALLSYRFEAMQFYALQDSKCRRDLLLEFMGNETVPCSGCDVCNKTARHYPFAMELLCVVVRRYPYQFSRHELIDFLQGKDKFLSLTGFGLFHDWEHAEIKAVIDVLVHNGILIEHKGFMKGLTCAFSHGKALRLPPHHHQFPHPDVSLFL